MGKVISIECFQVKALAYKEELYQIFPKDYK